VAVLDGEHEIAQRRRVRGDHMHVDADFAREHAARIAHAARVVDRVPDRQRVQHHPPLAQ
jgi:hypothetical protein